MDPGTASLISAGVGLLGSLFGGGGSSGPDYQQELYKKYIEILNMSMDLYNKTDFEAIDSQVLGNFKKNTEADAMGLLDNFNSHLTAAGLPTDYTDTEKTRTKGQIAFNAEKVVNDLAAQLAASRPGRKAGLLPSTQSAAGGFGIANALDSYNQQQGQTQLDSLMRIAGGIGDIFGKNKSSTKINPNFPFWLQNLKF